MDDSVKENLYKENGILTTMNLNQYLECKHLYIEQQSHCQYASARQSVSEAC